MISSFDLTVIVIALTVMAGGFATRFGMWRQGIPDHPHQRNVFQRWRSFFTYILSHKRILENRTKGFAHLFVFWGFIIPLLVVLISQFRPVMRSGVAVTISLLLDLTGLLALVGIGILLFDKYTHQKDRRKSGSVYLWIFLSIIITGFLAEGVRMGIARELTEISQVWSGPFGFVVSSVVPASPVFLKVIIRIHFFLVLIFVAIIPFTSMRHAVTAAKSVIQRRDEQGGVIQPIALEGDSFGVGNITDFTWNDLLESDACTNCRRCEDMCPAHLSDQPLSPRAFVKSIAQKMETAYRDTRADNTAGLMDEDGSISGEDIWKCTTCMACVDACPVFIRQLPKIIDLRRHSVLTTANFPPEYKPIFKNLEIFGDVFGAGKLMREDWCRNMAIPKAYETEKTDILFWVGCTGALYDEPSKGIMNACAKILARADIRFSVMGKEELCCGDPARRMGNEYLFKKIAIQNIEKLNQYGVKKLVVHCPHCFNVFRTEYPQFGADFEVVHFLEFVREILDAGKLQIQSKIDGRYTYHDPCYLGRYSRMVRLPRELLDALGDIELVEMSFSREKTFCCGAGGGNFWRGKTIGRRIEEARIDQAIETKTNGLISACPFCDIMFSSAVLQKGAGATFKTMDIVHLLDQATS